MVTDEMILFKDGRNSWVKPKDNWHRIIEKVKLSSMKLEYLKLYISDREWDRFPQIASCHCLDCDSVNLNVVFILIMIWLGKCKDMG